MEQHLTESSNEMNLYDAWKVVAKRRKLIFVLFLVTVISTAIIGFITPKIYRGEAFLNIMLYESMPAKELTDMVGKIDAEKRKHILSKTYSSVSDVELKALKDSKDKVIITIDAKNVDDIPKALSEIMDYLNNIDIVKMTVKEENEKLENKSIELSDVISSSTELVDTYHKLLRAGKLLPVGFNPIDLNRRIADIKLEKLVVEQSLQRLKKGGIGIATQLYISKEPVKPKIKLNVVIAGVVSIFFGIFLSFPLEYADKIKKGNRS